MCLLCCIDKTAGTASGNLNVEMEFGDKRAESCVGKQKVMNMYV